jgi:uncharacterized membrane protein
MEKYNIVILTLSIICYLIGTIGIIMTRHEREHNTFYAILGCGIFVNIFIFIVGITLSKTEAVYNKNESEIDRERKYIKLTNSNKGVTKMWIIALVYIIISLITMLISGLISWKYFKGKLKDESFA